MKVFDMQLKNARELGRDEMKKILGGYMMDGSLCPSDKPYLIECENGRARLICCGENNKERCCKAANKSSLERSIL